MLKYIFDDLWRLKCRWVVGLNTFDASMFFRNVIYTCVYLVES